MKILIAVPDTTVGGITTSVYNFSKELSIRGNEVYFLDFSATEKNGRVYGEVNQIFLKGRSRLWNLGAGDIKKASIIKKPFLAVLGVIKKIANRLGFWNRLIFKKEKTEYDVAIAFRQCAPCYCFVLNKVKAKKKIGFVHGDVDFMGDISSWQPFMKKFDKIAYVSDSSKRRFVLKYPEASKNAITVYNMFDYEEMKQSAALENPILFDKKVKNIVTVARIDNSSKQIDWIPDICAILKEKCKAPFRWYVLGDGPDLEAVQKKSAEMGTGDVLTFAGNIQNPYASIKEADLGVLTSRTEGYCMVVIETLSLGIPMVCTHFESVVEQMTDGVEGLISELNRESVAIDIKRMIDNHDGIYESCKRELSNREFTNEIPYKQFLESIK